MNKNITSIKKKNIFFLFSIFNIQILHYLLIISNKKMLFWLYLSNFILTVILC